MISDDGDVSDGHDVCDAHRDDNPNALSYANRNGLTGSQNGFQGIRILLDANPSATYRASRSARVCDSLDVRIRRKCRRFQ